MPLLVRALARRSCRSADVCALRGTGQIRQFAPVPCIDVVLHWMCRPAHRHPTGLTVNKEGTTTCVGVLDSSASLCRSAIQPRDDPSPVALLNGGDHPNIVAGRHQAAKYSSANSLASAASKAHDTRAR